MNLALLRVDGASPHDLVIDTWLAGRPSPQPPREHGSTELRLEQTALFGLIHSDAFGAVALRH